MLGGSAHMRKHALIVGLIFLFLLGFASWVILRPPPPRPNLTVRLSGYTNDVSGTRFAVFAVSNRSSDAVLRLSHYRIQIPTQNRWTDVSEDGLSSGGSALPAGGVETITIPAATNLSWRVSFSFSPDVGVVRTVLSSLSEASRSVGFSPRYRKMSYGVSCDWIGD